jgi:hypothetical protein
MSSFRTSSNSNAGQGQSPEQLYYDVVITNLENFDQSPPVLYFNETRNTPFVYDPESYYMSIIRFTLDTPTLPVIVPEIVPNQGNRDLTIYTMSLTYTDPLTGTTYYGDAPLIFQPQNLSAVLPNPPNTTTNGLQNNATYYYNIFNYQFFIYLVNNTFTTAFANLVSACASAVPPVPLPSIYAPIMTYDTTNFIAVINCDVAGYSSTLASPINIYFNNSLSTLFTSFPMIYQSLAVVALGHGQNVLIQTDSFGGSNILPTTYPTTPTGFPFDAIQVFQEYSSVALWTPVLSVVFCSNTLPIVPNQVSAPLLFIDGQKYQNGGNNSDVAQVISDFVSDSGIYKPNIVYSPSAQYRLIELTGNRPIYTLDVSVYWKDRFGALNPFRIGSGCSATLKFLFTKKGANTLK